MRKTKRFSVYTGFTGNLGRRVFEHKSQTIPGFTRRYNLHRLVFYENFGSPGPAIEREKEIKAWRRNKKIALIESMNPHWYDLAEQWGAASKQLRLGTAREIPLSA